MPMLLVELPAESLKGAIAALTPFAPSSNIKLYDAIYMPPVDHDDAVQALASQVVDAIRPQPTQPLRQEALRKLLNHHDTFLGQGGEPDPALRNAMGAISKALKAVFPHAQAIRRLAVPKKTYFPDGSYRGTVYQITALGERVRNILKAEGAI